MTIYDPELIQAVKLNRHLGQSISNLAHIFGLSTNAVRSILRHEDPEPAPEYPPEQIVREAVQEITSCRRLFYSSVDHRTHHVTLRFRGRIVQHLTTFKESRALSQSIVDETLEEVLSSLDPEVRYPHLRDPKPKHRRRHAV